MPEHHPLKLFALSGGLFSPGVNMSLKVGGIYTLNCCSYEGEQEVIVTAIGFRHVMLCPIPLVIFNGEICENMMTKEKFIELSQEKLSAA
ncbi:hypothetical protein ACT6F8_002675 [Cronobacter dublinensis]